MYLYFKTNEEKHERALAPCVDEEEIHGTPRCIVGCPVLLVASVARVKLQSLTGSTNEGQQETATNKREEEEDIS